MDSSDFSENDLSCELDEDLTTCKGLKKVCTEANPQKLSALKGLRKLGKRYKGKLVSNRLALDIGLDVLLGYRDEDEEDEEMLEEQLNELDTHQLLIDSQRRVLKEKLARKAERRRQEVEEVVKFEQTIETIAEKIREYWEKITVFKETEYIGFIVSVSPEKLTRDWVAAIFPDGFSQKPTELEARDMAIKLLRGVFE